MATDDFLEKYSCPSREGDNDLIRAQAGLADIIGQKFGEREFSRWRIGGKPEMLARSNELERRREITTGYMGITVARFGFSYGNNQFYEVESRGVEVGLGLTISEREIAVAATARMRSRPIAGDIVWRALSVRGEVILDEPLAAPYWVSLDETLRRYDAEYGSINYPSWELDCEQHIYNRFAYRPDGSVAAAMVLGANAPIVPDKNEDQATKLLQMLDGTTRLIQSGPLHFKRKSQA